ncbi:MAG: hypothetical protein KA144_11615 [Xanthomonadaceae bacterium]|nr:hypothetical protein [Xanthomonadaceae bacterium]
MKKWLLASLLCAIPLAAYSRLIPTPDDQDLFDRADAVVIAVPRIGRDTDERVVLPGIRPDVRVVGITTELEVKAWLKGAPREPKTALHHYRLDVDRAAQPLLNGPLLLEFHAAEARTYLMYLVREPDGRYAPATGQTDPAGFSVLRLTRDL